MARWSTACLLIGIVLLWPAMADAQKKKKKAKDQVVEATPAEYALLRAQVGAVGKIGSVNSSSKAFVLHIGAAAGADSIHSASTDAALAGLRSQIKLESVWQQQQRLLAAKSPQEAVKRLEQLRRAQRQLALAEVRRQSQVFQKSGKSGGKESTAKSSMKQFELEAVDKAVVRLGYLPVRYDDKGGIIDYTPREIEKLRGDKSKPGLAATFADLQAGQVVRVYFAKSKGARPAAKKDAGDEANGEAVSRPQVAMILILSESNEPLAPEPKKRKKKN
ncbi:MAG: hypothetical protein FJ271_14855 [Planctomycetes bacterium]|nr:hypothetical protein [Planctomycetota bacterium]